MLEPRVTLPEVSIAPDGAYSFSLPLSEARLARYRGETVRIRVDGLTFPVTIQSRMPLPLPCGSVYEAKYLAAAIALQIMSVTGDASATNSSEAPTPDELPMAIHNRLAGMSQLAEASSLTPGILSTFDLWRANHLSLNGAPTTPPYWHRLISRFVDHLGHDQLASVTSEDIRSYRDHLINSGRNIRTARHADFAAIRALFHFAVERKLIGSDPTSDVRFRLARLGTSAKMLAFSADEASAILSAADQQTLPCRRWIPWLTAFTGSRVATIANLRAGDVFEVEGLWVLRISRQAGPIKTAASERIVPLHPAILSRGFVEFARSVERERLFLDADASDAMRNSPSNPFDPMSMARYNPARSTIRRVTEWLHTLGLEIGREHQKDPNHAWRHWLKERAFEAGIPEKIADAIVGHAQATTARRYGSVALRVMANEIAKIPSPI